MELIFKEIKKLLPNRLHGLKLSLSLYRNLKISSYFLIDYSNNLNISLNKLKDLCNNKTSTPANTNRPNSNSSVQSNNSNNNYPPY